MLTVLSLSLIPNLALAIPSAFLDLYSGLHSNVEFQALVSGYETVQGINIKTVDRYEAMEHNDQCPYLTNPAVLSRSGSVLAVEITFLDQAWNEAKEVLYFVTDSTPGRLTQCYKAIYHPAGIYPR